VPYIFHYVNVTVSDTVLVWVTVYVLNPPAAAKDTDTPPEKVAVLVLGIFNITIPEPPVPGL
jgi:hypothetical protein